MKFRYGAVIFFGNFNFFQVSVTTWDRT